MIKDDGDYDLDAGHWIGHIDLPSTIVHILMLLCVGGLWIGLVKIVLFHG